MNVGRLVLSRKGFDSGSGGCPSPIFPDGTMYSLPIPSFGSGIAFGDLDHGDVNMGRLVGDLTGGRVRRRPLGAKNEVHLDPDLDGDSYPRESGWRGLLGQAGAAQGHLARMGVTSGDLFLFFGLYQRVEESISGWRFVRGSKKLHVLWGWLHVGEVRKVDRIRDDVNFRWARYHDHFRGREDETNTLYVAAESLELVGGAVVPGYGVFRRFDERFVLTDPYCDGVSKWRLPGWFYPGCGRDPLTYHGDLGRWRCDGNYAYLQSVGRGQEFVLDLRGYPEALEWVSGLVGGGGPSKLG